MLPNYNQTTMSAMDIDRNVNTPSRVSTFDRNKRQRIETPPGSVSDSMAPIEDDLKLLDRENGLPPFVKNILYHFSKVIQEQSSIIASVSLENVKLRDELTSVNQSIVSNNVVPSGTVVPTSQVSALPVCTHSCSADPCEDRERSRAIVISGVYESESPDSVRRNEEDMYKVKQVINSLGVECQPVVTYRMGQMSNRPRLLKVILPTSRHQRTLCDRSKFLRGSQFRGVWLRPSFTMEERTRHRLERQNGTWRGPGNPPQGFQGPRAFGDPSGVRCPRTGHMNGTAGSRNGGPEN